LVFCCTRAVVILLILFQVSNSFISLFYLNRSRPSTMAVSKKNDDDSTYQDDSDDSDTVPSSPKKTSEELFQLATNATLPARRRIQPNKYGSTPSPSLPPPSKPSTSKKKPTAPLVASARTNQSNNNSKTKKKRGRAATKKKTVSVAVTTTPTVPTGNPSLPMNGTFLGSLSLRLLLYVSSIPIIHFDFFLFHSSHFNYILLHFSIC
jgi:hypothetical protein